MLFVTRIGPFSSVLRAVNSSAILRMMRNNLNLSSEPFTNHRLVWLAIALVFLTSSWLVLWASKEKAAVRGRADQVSARAKELEKGFNDALELDKKHKEDELKAVLSPGDALQLEGARQLISKRSFSWNQMLNDLEKYVPKNSRISSITVEGISAVPQGAIASVDIKALGKSPSQLTEMMDSLNKSGGIFVVGQVSQDQIADNGEVPFSVTVTYRPRRGEG
jgi:hypothetical protein